MIRPSCPSTFSLSLGILLAACSGGALFAEDQSVRPIEFSGPSAQDGTAAPGTLVPGQTRMRQWESEVNRPLQGLTPGNTLDGMMLNSPLPMPPPSVTSSHPRGDEDKTRDWMFRTPEELFGIKSVEDKYKAPELTPDGRNRETLRPMVRAYLDAAEAARNPAAANSTVQTLETTYGSGINPELPGLDSALPFSAPANPFGNELQKALGWEANPGVSKNTDATDFFKFNNGYKAPDKPTAAELQRVEELKRLYDFNNTLPETATSGSDPMFSSPYVDKAFWDPPQPAFPSTTASTLNGGLNGASLGSATTPAWTPPTPSPAPEASRSVSTPASPFMNIPRRNF